MASESFPPPSTFHLVIPSADRASLLARRSGGALSLPFVKPPKCRDKPYVGLWVRDTLALSNVISAHFRIDVYVVNALFYIPQPEPDPYVEEALLLLEPRRYDFALPEGLEWLDREAALAGDWQTLHQDLDTREVLSAYFAQSVDGSVPDHPAPWRRMGWFPDLEGWILSTLKHHGMEVMEQLKQLVTKRQSTVLLCRVKEPVVEGTKRSSWNTDGYIYVKSTISGIPEAKKTLSVSSIMEGYVPKVLAIDEARKSMIQMGASCCYFEDRGAVMGMLADMQLASIERIEALKAGGVPDLGLMWLSSNIAELLRNPFLERCEHKESLEKLQGRVGEVQRLCDRLLAYGMPHTLVHGDFFEGNICEGVEPGRDFSVIDWANCCIGHPLIDYLRITSFEWEGEQFHEANGLYFEKWAEFEEPKRMKEAADLAYPLFLCYNLHTLLTFCEETALIDQSGAVSHLEDCLIDIGEALDEILKGPRVSVGGSIVDKWPQPITIWDA